MKSTDDIYNQLLGVESSDLLSRKWNVFLYIRWSSDIQRKGDSERRQMELEQLCQERGWKLVEVIKVDAVSAWKGHNIMEGSHLWNLVQKGKAGDLPKNALIVAEDFDRISRLHPNEFHSQKHRLNSKHF